MFVTHSIYRGTVLSYTTVAELPVHSIRILQATATLCLYQSDPQRVQQADLKKFEGPSDVVTSGATEELKEKLVVRQQYVMVIPNA